MWPHVWPWIYGDAFGSFPANGPGNMLTMTSLQADVLQRWVEGNFDVDWPPASAAALVASTRCRSPSSPHMLDKAALHFCLADTFHPGCEMTWPMRHASMYSKPFRIRHRAAGHAGARLRPAARPSRSRSQHDGPLYAQGPGDITRWMALPWQGDTAFCRSGYDPEYDPYVPTFWAARVPNQVLTEEDYQNGHRHRAAARASAWPPSIIGRRGCGRSTAPVVAEVMMRMIAEFGALGIVEARPGVKDDPGFPRDDVRGIAGRQPSEAAAMQIQPLLAAPPQPLTRIERAGWSSEEQFRDFRRIRVRQRVAACGTAIVAGAGPAGAVAAFILGARAAIERCWRTGSATRGYKFGEALPEAAGRLLRSLDLPALEADGRACIDRRHPFVAGIRMS